MSRAPQRFASLPQVVGWIVPFGLIVYLSLAGGGYDLVPRSAVAIGIWAALAVGIVAGVIPRSRLRRSGLVALGLLAGLALWWALAMIWSESPEDTFNEVARILFYLGILAAALGVHGRGTTRRTVAAIGIAISVVAALALLSRLHPQWFPVDKLAQIRTGQRERLNYPLNYWNGDAALFAMGIPLLLAIAESSRRLVVKALVTATIPVLGLAVFYTFSRAGWIAAALAVLGFLALHPRRVSALPTAALGSLGSVLLILAATQRDSLQSNIGNALAHSQGSEMIAIVIVLCAGVAFLRAGVEVIKRPTIPVRVRISRRTAIVVTAVVVCAGLGVAVAAGAPSQVSQSWEEFKQPGVAGTAGERLTAPGGNGRYQYWSAAVDAVESEPIIGIGPGTFQYWWTRHASVPGSILNAHSLYLETFAEGGIIGLALIVAFIGLILVGGVREMRRADGDDRACLTGALMAAVVFACLAAEDWLWQVPVIPVTFLMLAGVLLSNTVAKAGTEPRPWMVGPRWRIGAAAAAALAIAVSTNVLVATQLVRNSQASVRAGDLPGALDEAQAADGWQPWASSPAIQEALVLQLQGKLASAAAEARVATDRSPTDWGLWLARSQIEKQRGDDGAADRAFEKARSLNPTDYRFQGQ